SGQPLGIWDLPARAKWLTLEDAPSSVAALAFDREGHFLAVGDRLGAIQIRDVKSGQLRATLRGHPMRLSGLAFTPDGTRLASTSLDGCVKLWDPHAGVEVLSLRGEAAFDTAVAFSPDGEQCVAGGWDSFLRVWGLQDPEADTEAARRERRRDWHQRWAAL